MGVGGAAVEGGTVDGDEVAGAGEDDGGGADVVGVAAEVVGAEGGGPY